MRKIYSVSTVLLFSTILFGQSSFSWNFGTSAANPSPSSGIPIPNLTVSDISQGNNNGTTTLLTTTSASSGYTGASGQFNAGAAARTGALNTNANGSAYFEFTLTAAPGAIVNISKIDFGSRSTSTGPQAYSIRTSLDGFAFGAATGTFSNNSVWVLKTNTANITSSPGGAVTIRIYGYNGTGSASAGTANWRIDDLAVAVTVSGGTSSPTIIVSPTSLSGFTAATGTASASQNITVSGNNLTGNITVAASGSYEVSTDNTSFLPSVTLNQIGGIVDNTTVYTRISDAASLGLANGTLTLTSENATTRTVSLSGTVIGLINLTTSPYLQNFDGIGSGLPVGVTVKTGATASTLGTDAAFATAPDTWNHTTGGFKNFASGNNDQGVTQSTATDRAIGVRQVTATDPGAAFVFQAANTSGKINFALDFNLQSLDASSPRITTWRVDYGFGINPSTFIVPAITGILTTGGFTFTNNPIHVDFGSALDNQSGIITIRIATLTASSGSGNRASTGIDDFTLSWEEPSAKTISLSTTAINFPTTNIGSSNTSSYTIVKQTNLDQPIAITATSPYSISADNINFGSDLSIAPAEAFNKTIYVKFSPNTAGVFAGTITHSSEGIVPKIINLSGEAIDPNALTFNFNTCTVSSIPGSGFLSINVTGTQKWGCSQYGRNSTNGVDVNGFSGGAAQTNDAWLISPALNLNGIINIPVLSFYSRGEFTGPKLQLYVSTTYTGSGIPNIADWTELTTANFPTPPGRATTEWTLSDNIDLSAYKSATVVYIAFRYTSSPTLNAARWSLDDIAITDQSTLLTVSPVQLNFGEVSVGTNSASQTINFQAIGSSDLSLTPPPGYQISTDNISFHTNTIVIDQATATAGTTLYVRFSPVTKALKVEGNINVTAEGLDKDIVALIGSSFPKSETFDVACYNLSFFGSNSTNTATPEEIATKVANISTVMQHLNMDVIGIEEMSNDDALAQVTANLPGYTSVVSNRWSYSFDPPDPNFPPQKTGFVYNTATMSLSSDEPPRVMFESMYDSARLNLPGHRLADYPTGTPSSFWASGRLPFIATFNATIDGVTKKLRIVVIHAKSGGDPDGYTRRQYDVKVLKDSLDAFYANDKVFIIGDYNDRMVTSIYIGHPSSYQPFVDDTVNYNILTRPLDSLGRASFPGDVGMIDHVTISNDLTNEYISNSTDIEDARIYIPNYNATTASDHLPVFSRFQFCKLTCPGNITVSNTAGQCGATVSFDVSSTMTCGTVTAIPASGSFFPIGTTTVHVTASTGDTCSFTVTVNDNEIPTITCPVNQTRNTDANLCNYTAIDTEFDATANDNCSGVTITNDSNNSNTLAGLVFNEGETTIVWTATDAAGNTATCSYKITIEDHQAPAITAPANITVNTDAGVCYATNVSPGAATTSDNCPGETASNNAPSQFSKGITTVLWTVTDASGNTATAIQTVTVIDNEKPVITSCPVVPVFCYNTNGNYTIPVISGTDNCGSVTYSYLIAGSTNRSGNTNNASGTFNVGTSTITWTVKDGSNNASTCQTTVSVNPPINASMPDVYAVNPGGAANTIYVGYGPTSLTLNAIATGGTAPYSYKWTIGSSAGPALNNTSSYTVSPTAITTYYFNVKDVYGCIAPLVTKTVYVEDVRCGSKQDKVTVCQFAKGKYSTNCIESNNVSSALANGSYLGNCINSITKANVQAGDESPGLLTIAAMPNPSAHYFAISIKGGDTFKKMKLKVTDILGRAIEQKENLQTNSTLRIGNNYRPGVYIVEVIQGSTRKQIKLIKAGN